MRSDTVGVLLFFGRTHLGVDLLAERVGEHLGEREQALVEVRDHHDAEHSHPW